MKTAFDRTSELGVFGGQDKVGPISLMRYVRQSTWQLHEFITLLRRGFLRAGGVHDLRKGWFALKTW